MRLDRPFQLRALKLMDKIRAVPEIGKPMRNARKGTREVYLPPFRISYSYAEDVLTFLDVYHKDEQ